MPNWVRTQMQFTGANEELEKLYNDCGGDGSFSFNTFIPMPEELKIASGFLNKLAATSVWMQESKNEPEKIISIRDETLLCENIWTGESESPEWYIERALKHESLLKTEAERNAYFKLGETVLNNLRKYGHADWYTWCIANWGTKWDVNNDGSILSCPSNGEMTLYMETAWSLPEEVLCTIAEKYPAISFVGEYADEDIGYNCGEFSAAGGCFSINEHSYDPEFACDIWGYVYEEYKAEYEE